MVFIVVNGVDNFSLIGSSPAPLSSDQEKGKEPEEEVIDLASIDVIPQELLGQIFLFVANGGKDAKALCNLREVNSRWHRAVEVEILGPLWGQLEREIHNPTLQVFLRSDLGCRAESSECNYFRRFSHLTDRLRDQGAPIPSRVAVLGFESLPYENMQKVCDSPLEAMWAEISVWMHLFRRIDPKRGATFFPEEVISVKALGIRSWLKEPANLRAMKAYLNCSTLFVPDMFSIRISRNKISVIPCEIGYFSQLTKLDFSHNQIKIIPPEMGKLAQLIELDLRDNQITTIPSEIGRLVQLQELNFSDNWIETIPSEIGKLARLNTLGLHLNRIEAIPPEIGNLSQLQVLSLNNNQIINIPSEIGNLLDLRMLFLQHNQITTISPEIASLTRLSQLDLEYNRLASLPITIGNFPRLRYFNMDHNQFPIVSNADDEQAEISFSFRVNCDLQASVRIAAVIVLVVGVLAFTIQSSVLHSEF